MNNENKFWLALWSIVASLVSLIVICLTLNNWHEENVYNNLVIHGVDPNFAACNVTGNHDACIKAGVK